MRDFFKILLADGLYSEKYHDKTNNIYRVGESMIEFFSADSGDKVRGARRDYLFINECNNVSFETYNQLEVRTKNQIFLDYNPSHEFWVHEYLLNDSINHRFIKSTYRDNPYLDTNIVKSIESRRTTDPNWWRVFGEGELGFSESIIFTHWKQCKQVPVGNVVYGLDFGYNHPTVLVKVTEADGIYYAEQLLYESHLTNQQLIEKLKILIPNRTADIWADYSRPEQIREIYLAGFNIKDANKDVKKGIDSVKSKELFIHEGSVEGIKEMRSYSWKKDRNDKMLEEPIKANDDFCFIGSTLITTMNGDVEIKNIKEGDYVLTSNGYKKVLMVHNNGVKIVNKYSMLLDTILVSLCSTDNHLIKTDNTWTQISQLELEMMVYHIKHSTEKNISCIKVEDTLPNINTTCTKKYGSSIMAKGKKAIMSIIKMVMLGIIQLITWRKYKENYTYQNTQRKSLRIKSGLNHFMQKVLRHLKSGISQMRAGSGTKNMQGCTTLDNLNMNKDYVNCVKKNTQPKSIIQSSAIQTAKLKHLEKGDQWKEVVYDLTIEDTHEYFANGVLVHNCDALRYAIHSSTYAKVGFMKPRLSNLGQNNY